MGIACSVLDAVRKELQLHPGQRCLRVGLRVGEFAGVNPESLRFCFEAITKDGETGPLALEIEWCGAGELELAYLETDDLFAKEVMVESHCDGDARSQ